MSPNPILKLAKLMINPGRPKPDLEEIQRRKLKALVRHAYDHVPHYRKLFDSVSLRPEDIREVGDLSPLPLTDKGAMRAMELKEITADNIDLENCIRVFTSGSTGMPTHIYLTRADFEIQDLVYLRSFLQNGLSFLHKRAFILDPHSFDDKRRWYHRFGLGRYVNISCFEDTEKQVDLLRKARPDFLHGYPSSLGQVARCIIESGVTDVRPALLSTAAELLHGKDKERMKAAFGIVPFDRYAARECGNIAWECEVRGGYHINIDSLVVEFLKDGRPVPAGERGDVVVTNLHSYAMPFIRYRIGDLGIPSDKTCPCGRGFPLMEIVEGRDEDFIVLDGNRRISPMVITCTLDHVPGIRQFRVVQENRGSIVAWIARGRGYKPETPEYVKDVLRRIVGGGIDLQCRVVDDIPREASGKLRAVVSKVS